MYEWFTTVGQGWHWGRWDVCVGGCESLITHWEDNVILVGVPADLWPRLQLNFNTRHTPVKWSRMKGDNDNNWVTQPNKVWPNVHVLNVHARSLKWSCRSKSWVAVKKSVVWAFIRHLMREDGTAAPANCCSHGVCVCTCACVHVCWGLIDQSLVG